MSAFGEISTQSDNLPHNLRIFASSYLRVSVGLSACRIVGM